MPQERDLPSGTAEDTSAPQTYNEQVEDIANLLEDPDTDLQEDEGHDAADDAKADEADDDIINAEDVDGDTADEGNGPDEPEFKGGRFAADDAKVRLDDGSTITIAELKRNNLYQRDYTGKTTALAEERKQFDARKSEVDQQAQSLEQALQYVTWYAENYLPKAPEPVDPRVDPHGFQLYQEARQKYDDEQRVRAYFQQQMQAMSQQKQQEAEKAKRDLASREMTILKSKDALFRDDAKGRAWFQRAQELAGEYYGFAPQEIAGAILDHRLVGVLRDALRYRAQKAKAATVKDEVRRPVIAPAGRRQEPGAQATRQRQARSEQLRKTGTLEAGVAALMDFDL